jgi:hypothetical protein
MRPEYGMGLQGVIAPAPPWCGILNGVDTGDLEPRDRPEITPYGPAP